MILEFVCLSVTVVPQAQEDIQRPAGTTGRGVQGILTLTSGTVNTTHLP